MTRIVVTYHSSDRLAGEALASALRGRHYDVLSLPFSEHESFRDWASSPDDLFIIVLSRASLASGIPDQIATTVKAERLLQVLREDVATGDLRSLDSQVSLRSHDDVEAIVSWLSRASRRSFPSSPSIAFPALPPPAQYQHPIDAPAPSPPRPAYSVGSPTTPLAHQPTATPQSPPREDNVLFSRREYSSAPAPLQVEAGKLVHNIPSQMTKDLEELVEVRVGSKAVDLARDLKGKDQITEESIAIVETMTVELRSEGDAFRIDERSRKTQLVKRPDEVASLFNKQAFGSWKWSVIPLKQGKHELSLHVSADLIDSRGVPTSAALPPRSFRVRVSVNYARASWTLVKWATTAALGMLLAGLAGAFTQDAWWPKVKSWLQALNILGVQ